MRGLIFIRIGLLCLPSLSLAQDAYQSYLQNNARRYAEGAAAMQRYEDHSARRYAEGAAALQRFHENTARINAPWTGQPQYSPRYVVPSSSQTYSSPSYSRSYPSQSISSDSGSVIIDGQYYESAPYYGAYEVVPEYPGLLIVKLPESHQNAKLYLDDKLSSGTGRERKISFSHLKKGEKRNITLKVVSEFEGKRYRGETKQEILYGIPKVILIGFETAEVEDIFQADLLARKKYEEKQVTDWVDKTRKALAERKAAILEQKTVALNQSATQKDEILKKRIVEKINQAAEEKLAHWIHTETDLEAESKQLITAIGKLTNKFSAEYTKQGLVAVPAISADLLGKLEAVRERREAFSTKRIPGAAPDFLSVSHYLKEEEERVRTYETGTMDKWKLGRAEELEAWSVSSKAKVDAIVADISRWSNQSEKTLTAIPDPILKDRVKVLFEAEKTLRNAEITKLIPVIEAEKQLRSEKIAGTYHTFVSAYRANADMDSVVKAYVDGQASEKARRSQVESHISSLLDAARQRQRDGVTLQHWLDSETKVRAYELRLAEEVARESQTTENWFATQMKERKEKLSDWKMRESAGLQNVKYDLVRASISGVFHQEEKTRMTFESERTKSLEAERDRRKGFIQSFSETLVREFRETHSDTVTRAVIQESALREEALRSDFDRARTAADEAELRRGETYPGVEVLERKDQERYPLPHLLAEGCGNYFYGQELTGTFSVYYGTQKDNRTKIAEFAEGELLDVACSDHSLALIASKISFPDQPAKETRDGLWFAVFHRGALTLALEPELKRSKFERVWFDVAAREFVVTSMEESERFSMAVSLDGSEWDQIETREVPAKTAGLLGRITP